MSCQPENRSSTFSPVFLPSLLRQFGFGDWSEPFPVLSQGVKYTLSEDDTHVYLEVPMPGIEAEDINITYDKGLIKITAQKKKETSDSKRKYYERASYNYAFTFALPGDLDEQHDPAAAYEQGVLHLTFDKMQKAQPKKISVQRSR